MRQWKLLSQGVIPGAYVEAHVIRIFCWNVLNDSYGNSADRFSCVYSTCQKDLHIKPLNLNPPILKP